MAKMTLAKFAEKLGITMRVEWEPKRPDGLMGDMSRHFRCVLRCKGTSKRMTVHFSQGSAHTAEPTVEEVLNCLAMDSSGWENSSGDFLGWAREYGFDLDDEKSIKKARKIFNACEKQALATGKLVGLAYEDLLYKTESL